MCVGVCVFLFKNVTNVLLRNWKIRFQFYKSPGCIEGLGYWSVMVMVAFPVDRFTIQGTQVHGYLQPSCFVLEHTIALETMATWCFYYNIGWLESWALFFCYESICGCFQVMCTRTQKIPWLINWVSIMSYIETSYVTLLESIYVCDNMTVLDSSFLRKTQQR